MRLQFFQYYNVLGGAIQTYFGVTKYSYIIKYADVCLKDDSDEEDISY